MIKKIICCIICRLFRGVAQFGSALGSGPRGRGFKSRHLDQSKRKRQYLVAFFILCDYFCNIKIESISYINMLSILAGETRFEHATYGFGDRYSTVEPLPYSLSIDILH